VSASRNRLIRRLDWASLTFVLISIAIDLTGGFYFAPGGVRISAQTSERPLYVAIGLLLVRYALDRRTPFLGGRLPVWWTRVFDRRLDPQPADHARGWVSRHFLIAAAGFVAVGAVLLHTQLAHMDSVPDLGDPLFSIWRMGWVFHHLQGDPRPLFDANIFYPEPLTLTYSDSMLVPALTEAPLLAAGVHPVVAYNVLFLASYFLSAIATYSLIVRLTGSAQAGFIGGLIYGFYPYRFEHYSHLELQMTYWMPLALLALHRFAATFNVAPAIVLTLCVVAQLYSSMYYGVFFPMYAAVILGVLLWIARPAWRRLAVPLAIGATLAVVLAVPLARPYFAAQGAKGERDENTVTFYSAQPSDYFRAHPRSALYGGRLLSDSHPERALFPGVTPLVLSAVSLVAPVGPIRLAYAAGMLVAFDLSRGFTGYIYKHLYAWFGPIRGMRVPARVSIIMAISLAVLGGFGALRLIRRFGTSRGRALAFIALVAAVATDLHPKLELEPVWPKPPAVYGSIAPGSGAVLAEFPFTSKVPGIADDLQYMYFSTWHWLPLVNGYSGFSSEPYREWRKGVLNFPDAVSFAALKARGVTHLTLNCAFVLGDCEPLLTALDERRDLQVLSSVRWQGAVVRLYALSR
jgi:hypothetical protein